MEVIGEVLEMVCQAGAAVVVEGRTAEEGGQGAGDILGKVLLAEVGREMVMPMPQAAVEGHLEAGNLAVGSAAGMAEAGLNLLSAEAP